jgi:hypothetical protein
MTFEFVIFYTSIRTEEGGCENIHEQKKSLHKNMGYWGFWRRILWSPGHVILSDGRLGLAWPPE